MFPSSPSEVLSRNTCSKKMRDKPAGEYPCRSMISLELPHSFIKAVTGTACCTVQLAGGLNIYIYKCILTDVSLKVQVTAT